MIPVLLTSIKTRDGITLDGIAVLPKQKSDTALIWIHGLSSRFSSGQTLIKELSRACMKNHIGYFKFNTRGHDIVSRDKNFIGSCFENFRDCVYDIRAMILYAKKLGFKKVILAGHSTGANKALFYAYKTKDHAVKGMVLVGPINDVAAETKRYGKRILTKAVHIAEILAKKNPQALIPQRYGIYSASRFLSLYRPGSAEDVFPYYNSYETTSHKNLWKELKSIRAPIAIILGSRDEHLDRPAKDLLKIFQAHASSTKSFTGVIIPQANHSFRKKEKELTDVLIHWVKQIEKRQRAVV